MVILDPDRDGCVVWLINSPITEYKNKVTRVKGETAYDTCLSLISRLAGYKTVKNQWGNSVEKLFWADDIYLDNCFAFGKVYKDVFDSYDLDVIDILSKNADTIIPERTYGFMR